MNKTFLAFLFGFFLLAGLFFLLVNNAQPQTQNKKDTITNAEKIEIIHFRATQQCVSCVTVGEYTNKAIQENFPNEYEEGIITFKTINVEDPENRDVVSKYQARASSVFINAIIDGEDNIEEDINVWRYITNEESFINYFEKKLNTMLGK